MGQPRIKTFTKHKSFRSDYRLTVEEYGLMIRACQKLGESRSEFLRRAARMRALQVLCEKAA
jgi:uncharacterized protein (DUF1778 family)